MTASATNGTCATASDNSLYTVCTFTNTAGGTFHITSISASTNYYTALQGSGQTANITYNLPAAQGGASTVLTNNGSGTLSWATPASGWVGTATSDLNINNFYITNGTQPGDSNFIGNSAGSGAAGIGYDNFLGFHAGLNAGGSDQANFLGKNAGNGAISGTNSNFFGTSAGSGSYGANNSNFLGASAGSSTGNSGSGASASYSNFLGGSAGSGATNANNSNFLGYASGQNASQAFHSNFLGDNSGSGATNASNSIFIGTHAGLNDTVNNYSTGGTSIAIGNYSGTGGYSNSVAIGHGVTNSAATQMNLGNVININGIYNSNTQSSAFVGGATVNLGSNALTTTGKGSFGTFQLGTSTTSGYVLTADASGNGTWQAAAGGVPYTGATSDMDLGSHNLATTGTVGGGIVTASTKIGVLGGTVSGSCTGGLGCNETLHYLMNDNAATSTVLDSIGSDNGTAHKNTSVLYVGSGNPSNLSGSLLFNQSSGDGVDVPYNSILNTSVGSVSMWVKTNGTAILFSKATTGSSSGYFTLGIFGGSGGNLGIYSDHGSIFSKGSIGVANGAWHHLVFTADGTSNKIYVDGVQDSFSPSVNSWFASSTGNNFSVGYSNTTNSTVNSISFNGDVADVRVYNYALTQSSVSAIYNSGNGTPSDATTGGTPTNYYTYLQGGGSQTTNITYSMPSTPGGASTVLTNNGSGVLSWVTPASGWVRYSIK